jgi:hypothetical protein
MTSRRRLASSMDVPCNRPPLSFLKPVPSTSKNRRSLILRDLTGN